VFAESVFIFIEDKAQAIREAVRVTKPGGLRRPERKCLDQAAAAGAAAQVRDASAFYGDR